MAEDPTALARRSAQAMWAEDRASRGLGMRLEHVAPGSAVLSMAITEVMVNGHGTCHGGFIFLLADSAFAFACNSHNQKNVAQNCQIAFIAPGQLGMRLIAEARERHRGERSGIYDVTVKTDAGELIAEFRGHSRAIPGTLVRHVMLGG
ncbi:MAG: hydroxyphenylacetyl-CoA thioesterase PaaI [Hyphomicrobiaceae bacterium]|jgi:acyl-CoA thioesterase